MILTRWDIDAGQTIARALGMILGIVPSQRAWVAFAAQAHIECAGGISIGARNNNPLNLTTAGGTITWPGQTATYGGGSAAEPHDDFAAFGSLAAGCWACAANYDGGSYPGVLKAFRGGDPAAIAGAIQNSPWDSDHYSYRLADEVRALEANEVTDEELRAAIKRIYAGPDSIEEWVKADIRLMIEQDPWTKVAIQQAVAKKLAS